MSRISLLQLKVSVDMIDAIYVEGKEKCQTDFILFNLIDIFSYLASVRVIVILETSQPSILFLLAYPH